MGQNMFLGKSARVAFNHMTNLLSTILIKVYQDNSIGCDMQCCVVKMNDKNLKRFDEFSLCLK